MNKPTRINLPFSTVDIKDIQIGGGHTLILTNSGKLYGCGWNNKGQLGFDSGLVTFTPLIFGLKFNEVACGWDFTAAILENKNLLVWGSNVYQQIGLGKNVKQINNPTVYENIQAVKIACGLRHLLVLTAESTVMVCGSGTKGQLGLVDETGSAIRQSDLQIIPSLNNIVDVACGQYHSLVLHKNKRTVYGWGNNKYGQLSFAPDVNVQLLTPVKLSFDVSSDIFSLKAGWTHTVITTVSEEIYTFGRNNYGQLGGLRDNYWVPEKVPLKGQGFAGSEHNLVLSKSDKGTLYSWGWNEHGNCGVGHTENVLVPTVVIQSGVKCCFTGGAQCFAIVAI